MHDQTKMPRTALVAAALLAPLLLVGQASGVAAATCTPRTTTTNFHEEHVGEGSLGAVVTIPADVASVPTWSGSFTTDGKTYPYTMVGTDPAAGSATTTVPVLLVPLRFDFASSHCSLGDDRMATEASSSPIFQGSQNTQGRQYLDELQQDNFWKYVSTTSPDYHVLLGTPKVAPTQTISIPAAQGITWRDSHNLSFGMVSGEALYLKLNNLINSLHVDPRTLVVFLADNIYATEGNPEDCFRPQSCAYYSGFHGAIANDSNARSINTYAFASMPDFGDQVPPGLDFRSVVLSHELVEWMNDPFVLGRRVRGSITQQMNLTPAWQSPFDSFGCQDQLEVADPLEDWGLLGFTSNDGSTVYGLADMAFLSWFARESPSTALNGRYDAAGAFATYSTPC